MSEIIDAKIQIKNSHESLPTPLHTFLHGVLSFQSPLIFPRKKSCAQTFMAFQIIFQFTVSKHQAAIIVANTWSKRMTWQFHDKKGPFFAISQIVSFIRKKVCIANFFGKAKSVGKGKYYSKCLISSKTQNLSVKAFYE